MRKEWDVKTLENVCKMYQPKTVAKKNLISNGKYPVFGANGIIGRYNKYNHENPELLVTCRGATCGTVNISEPFSWINGNAMVIKPGEHLLKSYVAYFFRGAININDVITGSAQPQITRTSLNSVKIPIPPLPEQKRIVAILDEAFEAIDQAKANIERNIENAEELFQSKLNEIFNKEIKEWDKRKLEDVCEEIFAGGDTPKENFSKEATDELKVPVIGNAVKNRGLHGFTNEPRVTKPSITIAARGSGTGHTEVRNEPYLPVVRLIVLIPNNEKVRLSFLKYVIDNLEILRSGTAIPQLTVPMIKSYSFHIPDIEVQKQIEGDLDTLSDDVNEIIEVYYQKIESLDELKKSILQKAFSGELTANEHVAA